MIENETKKSIEDESYSTESSDDTFISITFGHPQIKKINKTEQNRDVYLDTKLVAEAVNYEKPMDAVENIIKKKTKNKKQQYILAYSCNIQE